MSLPPSVTMVLKCPVAHCGQILTSIDAMEHHIDREHLQTETCLWCQMTFYLPEQLEMHVLKAHEDLVSARESIGPLAMPREIECGQNDCNWRFFTNAARINHIMEAHAQRMDDNNNIGRDVTTQVYNSPVSSPVESVSDEVPFLVVSSEGFNEEVPVPEFSNEVTIESSNNDEDTVNGSQPVFPVTSATPGTFARSFHLLAVKDAVVAPAKETPDHGPLKATAQTSTSPRKRKRRSWPPIEKDRFPCVKCAFYGTTLRQLTGHFSKLHQDDIIFDD